MTPLSGLLLFITFMITMGYFVESVIKKEKTVEWGAFVGMIGSLVVMCIELTIMNM